MPINRLIRHSIREETAMRRMLVTLSAGFLVLFLFASAHTQHINSNFHFHPGINNASPGEPPHGSPILPAVAPDRWMEQAAAYIGKKPYNRIAIPGTHDSGTYGLISTYDRPANDAFAPDAESWVVKAGTFAGIAEIWAKAQDNNIYQQLVDGIRAIDYALVLKRMGLFESAIACMAPR